MNKKTFPIILSLAFFVTSCRAIVKNDSSSQSNTSESGANSNTETNPEAADYALTTVTSTFQVASATAGFVPPKIVVQYNAANNSGFNWTTAVALRPFDSTDAGRLRNAVRYVQEGILKTSKQKLDIINSDDISTGIVFTTLAAAPSLAGDTEITTALNSDGKDAYNNREAFFIRSEVNRLLIVANTVEGLIAAVPELMESAGYEVLGMGPNWTYVPGEDGALRDATLRPLSFTIKVGGRAGYYNRSLWPTSAQQYGVGTVLTTNLSDPTDETVDKSLNRWQIGSRMQSMSMASFPGAALQAYHKKVLENIVSTGVTDGFLAKTLLGANAARPAASSSNTGSLWVNSDAPLKAYLSTGTTWTEANLAELGVSLDLSVPAVRSIIFEELKRTAELGFSASPDKIFVFPTEPEDGNGHALLGSMLKNKLWYTDYLTSRGVAFGQPYVLSGYLGLVQSKEIWDYNAASDTVFGFNNWLLREYDLYIASLPAEQRVTLSGRSKKDMLRTSFYSYNYYDVPPNFNLDPRMRVMIAGYPKNRGKGKWLAYATQIDLARAFQKMLPSEPSGDYRILSFAFYRDPGLDNIPSLWSASSKSIQSDLNVTYTAGIKAFAGEIDFNFGKYGLAYYLQSKALWKPSITQVELEAMRDRWLQRSFGSGWSKMKEYYNFQLLDNTPISGPNTWAHAITLLDAADKLVDPVTEKAAKRRIDDVKQFWYYYYLTATGHMQVGSAPSYAIKSVDALAKEFVWKGQMSYMVAQHVVTRRTFSVSGEASLAAGPELASGPAHFTAAETAAWWTLVKAYWPETPVTQFANATLANGVKANTIDLNDLVLVKQFNSTTAAPPFLFNSGYQPLPTVLNVATVTGQAVGFQLSWPRDPASVDPNYIAKNIPYGVELWDTASKTWTPLIDILKTVQASRTIDLSWALNCQCNFDGTKRHLAEVRFTAPKPGTYRFTYGAGGNATLLTGLDFDLATGKLKTGVSRTGFSSLFNATGWTQPAVYIYLPKGTKTLDLEVWDSYNLKTVTFYKGWRGSSTLPSSRKVSINNRMTHVVPLLTGEDGSLAKIEGKGFAFPYIYSVPGYWAKSPRDLLVPRAIVRADLLTVGN